MYNFHGVKRIDYTWFQFPESARIDAMASTIQYSADEMTALADEKKSTGRKMMFSSKAEAAR